MSLVANDGSDDEGGVGKVGGKMFTAGGFNVEVGCGPVQPGSTRTRPAFEPAQARD